jgi:hypothetical protein
MSTSSNHTKVLSSAVTASTQWRVRELYCHSLMYSLQMAPRTETFCTILSHMHDKKNISLIDGFWLYLCTFAKLLFAVPLIGRQLSIWNCCKLFFSLLYNCQLLCFWRLALSIVVESSYCLFPDIAP